MLDYREYIHLQVEVLRQGSPDWELANPTRLSTGEAIGVGAALMMVVLTEWERDANLLRGRKPFGSMRFLFLDEANRLHPRFALARPALLARADPAPRPGERVAR